MYADAIENVAQSIFPIFFITIEGDLSAMGVCGTGFFVDSSGLFLTADHFMTPVPTGMTHYYYGRVPDDVCHPALEIERVANDPARDLFLGRVVSQHERPVQFAPGRVRPGDTVCLAGYPMAVVAENPEGGFVGNVQRYWQPTFVVDATQAAIGNRMYDGYIVQDACLPGMSGGPAFDTQGRVCGMAVATLTRTIPQSEGYPPLVVSNGIVIDVDRLRAFIEPFARD